MIFKQMKRLSLLLAALALLCTGCAATGKRASLPVYPDGKTAAIMAGLSGTNRELRTFKGTGAVHVTQDNREMRYRLAWAGAAPDKLYMVVLLSGNPVETLVTDGRKVRLKSHTGAHQAVAFNTSDPDLDKLLSIPVKITDLISLITGRTPLAPHRSASLTAVPGGYALHLKNRRGRTIQTVYLNSEESPTGYERFSSREKPLYKAEMGRLREHGGYKTPKRIALSSGDGTRCIISVDRYYTNPPLAPDLFTRTP